MLNIFSQLNIIQARHNTQAYGTASNLFFVFPWRGSNFSERAFFYLHIFPLVWTHCNGTACTATTKQDRGDLAVEAAFFIACRTSGIHVFLYGLRDIEHLVCLRALLGKFGLPTRTARLEARENMAPHTLRSRFACPHWRRTADMRAPSYAVMKAQCGSLLHFGTGDRSIHNERQLWTFLRVSVSGIPAP